MSYRVSVLPSSVPHIICLFDHKEVKTERGSADLHPTVFMQLDISVRIHNQVELWLGNCNKAGNGIGPNPKQASSQ